MKRSKYYNLRLPERGAREGEANDAADIEDLTYDLEIVDEELERQRGKDEELEKLKASRLELAQHQSAAVLDHPDDSVTDAKIGARTVLTTSGTLQELLTAIGNAVKAATGAGTWNGAPATTLKAAKAHMDSTSNPHSVTKAQVGLGNVPNVSTNSQTPTYTAASSPSALKSGETLSAAFAKLAAAVSALIAHLADTAKHITSAERTLWNTVSGKLPLSGGTLTGFLTLHAAPTANLHAATKKYVDDKLAAAGGGDMLKSVYDADGDGIVDMAAAVAQGDALYAAAGGIPLVLPGGTQITAAQNRIENVTAYGFTAQAGSGDPSPTNVRPIENAGMCNKRITINQNSAITLSGEASVVGTSRRVQLAVSNIPQTESNVAGAILCNALTTRSSVDTYGKDVPGISIQSNSSGMIIAFRVPGCMTIENYKSWLTDNPLDVAYLSTENTGKYYTGISVTQGDSYRCDIIELQAPLHEGDTLETNTLYDGAQKCVETHVKDTIILTGTETTSLYQGTGNPVFLIYTSSMWSIENRNKGICNWYPVGDTGHGAYWLAGPYGNNPTGTVRLVNNSITTVEDLKSDLASKYAAGTPVTIEYELAVPEVYEGAPATVRNEAGTFTVSGESDVLVRLCPTVSARELEPKMDRADYDADGDGIVDAAASAPWAGITDRPSAFPPDAHTHTKSQITDFPASLKNPAALTISLNGTSQGAYDGSAAKSVNVTPAAIGAFATTDVIPVSKGGTGATTIKSAQNNLALSTKTVVGTTDAQGWISIWTSVYGEAAIVGVSNVFNDSLVLKPGNPKAGGLTYQVVDLNGTAFADKTVRLSVVYGAVETWEV